MPWDERGEWWGECPEGCDQGWHRFWRGTYEYARRCVCLEEEVERRKDRKRSQKVSSTYDD